MKADGYLGYTFCEFRKIGIVISLLCCIHAAFGQVTQPHRYERTQKNSDDYFNVISLEEDGVALFREREKFKNNNRIWELILLDTTLHEKKLIEIEIKERHKLIGYEVTPDILYFLYRTGETNKADFELIAITLNSGSVTKYTIKPELDFKLTHFIRVADKFAFGGYVSNDPAILLYEPATNLIKAVPGFFQKDTELVDLRVNQNKTLNVIMIDRGTKGERNVTFRTFDPNGNLLLDDLVPIEDKRTVQTGIASTLKHEDLMVLGTWGEGNSKQSNGFFSFKVDPFNDQKVNFIAFGELEHYLDYIKPKRAQRIKKSTKEDLDEGKIPGFINYVMPYKIIEYQDGFLLFAEVYQPSNNLNPYYTNPYYNPYYNPYGYNSYWPGYYPGMSRMYRPSNYGSNVKNSDEIKMYETVLISFDNNGQIKWDQSMKLDDMKISALEQVADVNINNNHIHFVYRKESEVRIKTIFLQDNTESNLTEKIKSQDPLDEIRSEKESEASIKYWYKNAFYTYGYQTVRNISKEERVRDVFYINKVVIP